LKSSHRSSVLSICSISNHSLLIRRRSLRDISMSVSLAGDATNFPAREAWDGHAKCQKRRRRKPDFIGVFGGQNWIIELTEESGSSAGSCRLRLFAQRDDAVLQRPNADTQHIGGEFAITAHVLEGELDVSLLEFHEWLARLKHD